MMRFAFPAARAATVPHEPGRLSARIFAHGRFEACSYAPRLQDRPAPHPRDDAYVVVRGQGWFACEGARAPIAPGDLVCAPAGTVHRLEDFSDDLAAGVVFCGPEGGEA